MRMRRKGLKSGEWSMVGPFFIKGVTTGSLDRDIYFVFVSKKAGESYKLVRYRDAKHRVIVGNAYPAVRFRSVRKALEVLSRLEKPLPMIS